MAHSSGKERAVGAATRGEGADDQRPDKTGGEAAVLKGEHIKGAGVSDRGAGGEDAAEREGPGLHLFGCQGGDQQAQ